LNLDAGDRSGDLVLRTHGLKVGYCDDKKVLINVPDIVLRRKECAALMGPNGAGKSTFLKTALGELKALDGKAEMGASVRVGYFAQAHEGLHEDWTLVEEIMAVAPKMLEGEIRSYLATFLFTGEDVFKQVNVLSGGERGRLAMACLALQGANLLLLDEPTNHLDLPSQEILQRVLAEFNGTILLVSHDRFLVDGIATQVWQVRPEQKDLIVFKGNYSALRSELDAEKNARKPETQDKQAQKTTGNDEQRSKRINPRLLRELEAAIAGLEEEIAVVSRKLEHPLEVSESVEDLGKQYVRLQGALDAKWHEWHALFED